MFQNLKENPCVWRSRAFASDAHPRRQDSSKMAQDSSKKCPRKPEDGAKSAQERSKSPPRAVQEAILEAFQERR
eukprot:4381441-Pyramimonas_sp.AAC.1